MAGEKGVDGLPAVGVVPTADEAPWQGAETPPIEEASGFLP